MDRGWRVKKKKVNGERGGLKDKNRWMRMERRQRRMRNERWMVEI